MSAAFNDEKFLMQLARRCFHAARLCSEQQAASEFSLIGKALLARAHRDAQVSAQGCIDEQGQTVAVACRECTRACPF